MPPSRLPYLLLCASLFFCATPFLILFSLLLFGSGVPTAEKPTAERFYLLTYAPSNKDQFPGAWKAYKEYLRSTSILLPLPPVLYRPLPFWMKRWLLLDLPLYEFDEKTDGLAALEKEKKKSGGNMQ